MVDVELAAGDSILFQNWQNQLVVCILVERYELLFVFIYAVWGVLIFEVAESFRIPLDSVIIGE